MLLHEFKWKEVIQASEPVLVDFWASWCGPCRAFNPTIEALARDFKVCKVNVDTNQELAAHYGISSIPAEGMAFYGSAPMIPTSLSASSKARSPSKGSKGGGAAESGEKAAFGQGHLPGYRKTRRFKDHQSALRSSLPKVKKRQRRLLHDA